MLRTVATILSLSVVPLLAAAAPASEGEHRLPPLPDALPVHGVTALTLRAQADRSGHSRFEYRGSFVPPTLRVVPGGRLEIRYVNDLPRHSTERCWASNGLAGPCMDMTNLHFHGMEVSPNYGGDDVLTMLAMPGQTLQYDVRIPRDVPPGLYWYHTHPHHESDRQVLDGMSGAIVVEGISRYVPQLRTMPERILVLRTAEFPKATLVSAMRRLDVTQGECGSEPETPDQLFTVNGVMRPTIAIAPGEQQFWRIVNASADRYTDLRVDGSLLQVVALDGEPFALHDPRHPIRTMTHILVPPAGRVEAIVTGPPAGIAAALRMHCVDTGPDGDPNPGQVLADIVPQHVALPAEPESADVPAAMTWTPDLSAIEHAPPRFTVTFTEHHHLFFINGKTFSMDDPPMTTVRVGSYVHWRIVNKTNEIHPFHIHQVHFLTYAVNGHRVQHPVWTDTMNVPLKQSIDVVLDANDVDIAGLSVFHCHILSHEDKGMMAKVLFTPPSPPRSSR
jgi:FtsP/CotA-like multicopper oxidase with cupredoxin domain